MTESLFRFINKINHSTEENNNKSVETTQPKSTEIEDKEKTKKEKWAKYMKDYRQKKKDELAYLKNALAESKNKVELRCNNKTKLYNIDDINNLIADFISILCRICANNSQFLDMDKLNNDFEKNSDDIYELSIIVQKAVLSLL